MIILFNLNKYLGGGEVILLRFAEHLKSKNVPFSILCMNDSYIFNKALENDYKTILWPSSVDSFFT